MFWSGNYIVVRELNFLLKEENVTLSQVLEADDILQECKADNKALIQFLTRPEILAELITLITEEPPKNLELATQYRHANIACEVLTSHLSMLSDRLSLDATQMNRLCDFINRDPPLNPLLASYFSKTVEMLLERSPKQDCYLYHIVCLRVLDFFKSRRDFLPNLLRHMSTSAIADTFKYFIRLDDLFKKTVMEWLEEHQFLECLIQIVCGTYVPEELSRADPPAPVVPQHDNDSGASDAHEDKGPPKELDNNGESDAARGEAGAAGAAGEAVGERGEVAEGRGGAGAGRGEAGAGRAEAEAGADEARRARVSAVAAANAAALLCDLIVNGCAPEGCATRGRASWALVRRLASERGVRALLQGMFTSPPPARAHALVHGCHVLRALLAHEPLLRMKASSEEDLGRSTSASGVGGGGAEERSGVELALAPHLPLLHHALLHDPLPHVHNNTAPAPAHNEGGAGMFVRAARVHVAGLLAQLAQCELDDVPATMLTLGTPGVLVDMFFAYPNNNFLHAQVFTLVKHALNNRVYRTQYARHLLVECDLLTRLMDVFEENQNNKTRPRAAYMGHVVLCLTHIARALAPPDLLAHALALPAALLERWQEFHDNTLRPLLQQHDTPLGGYYPSENIYEVEIMADTLAANYDFNDMAATGNMDELADDGNVEDGSEMCGAMGSSETPDFIADGLGIDDADKMRVAKSNFLELASQRFDDDMWEDSGDVDVEPDEEAADPDDDPAVRDVLEQHSPWEGAGVGAGAGAGACGAGGAGGGGEGWAQFGAEALSLSPHDPFAPPASPPSPASPAAPATPAHEQFAHAHDFTPFWAYDTHHTHDPELEASMRTLRLEGELTDKRMDEASSVELANNLLTAMSAMSADAIANIVNANLPDATCDVTGDATDATDTTDTTDHNAASAASAASRTTDTSDASDTSGTSDKSDTSGAPDTSQR